MELGEAAVLSMGLEMVCGANAARHDTRSDAVHVGALKGDQQASESRALLVVGRCSLACYAHHGTV